MEKVKNLRRLLRDVSEWRHELTHLGDTMETHGAVEDGFMCIVKHFDTLCLNCVQVASHIGLPT